MASWVKPVKRKGRDARIKIRYFLHIYELTLGSKVRLGRTCLKKSGDSELRDL